MPPKRKQINSDFDISSLGLPFDVSKLSEDGRLIVSIMMFSMKANNDKFYEELAAKDNQITSLNEKIRCLSEKMEMLEEKNDDSEALERKNFVVVSGPNLPAYQPDETPRIVVHKLLKDKYNLNVPLTDLLSAQRLGNRLNPTSANKKILVKLASTDLKNDVFQASKTMRPEGLYMYENLTPTRNSILFVLRKAKREFSDIVSGCRSLDGKVFVWIRPPNPQAVGAKDTRISVNSFRKLDKFCLETLKKSTAEFVPNWTN